MSNPVQHKIVLVGAKDVGKASFKSKMLAEHNMIHTSDRDPCGQNRLLSWSVNQKSFKIEFKIVEPDEYAAVRDSFFRSASGFICMFSVNDMESYEATQKMREQILDVRCQTKIILFGNKCDDKAARKVPKRDAKRLAKKWKAEYIEGSVKENKGLDDCMDILLRSIVENKHTGKVRERSSLKSQLDRFKYYNCFQEA